MYYDYLIVGAGLYGAIFAYEMKQAGKKCLVIDKRNHIAGNVYTKQWADINVHWYGAHIFHTSNRDTWDYINQFASFNNYINSPMAVYGDEIYNLPFNMNTFSKMWGVKTPAEAKAKINEQVMAASKDCDNLEDYAISMVGRDIYEKLIKGYTEKQWGRECRKLPAFIIKRLPLRFTYDNNYFNDRYQGIPQGGYTQIVEKLLEGTEVILDTDYKTFVTDTDIKSRYSFGKVLYTGRIDEYFDYCFGKLEYRSLRFEHELMEGENNYQGNAVMNYTKRDVPFTRIIEHKHFEFGTQADTVITREYPAEWKDGEEPYYPVNDERNNSMYDEYARKAKEESNVIFGGRLGSYKYYDMDKIIEASLEAVRQEMQSFNV